MPPNKHRIKPEMWRIDGLTRHGTAEPSSPDQILRHERGQEVELIFPVQLTTGRSLQHDGHTHTNGKSLS